MHQLDGSPETDAGSEIMPADLKPLGETDFNNPDEGPVVTALGSPTDTTGRGAAPRRASPITTSSIR